MEADTGFLKIYDGGSEQAEMIANFSTALNHNKISTPRNQMFAMLHTNAGVRISATVIKSMYVIKLQQ